LEFFEFWLAMVLLLGVGWLGANAFTLVAAGGASLIWPAASEEFVATTKHKQMCSTCPCFALIRQSFLAVDGC
jgi:hypothetical protein